VTEFLQSHDKKLMDEELLPLNERVGTIAQC
jgi:hypothetical protein